MKHALILFFTRSIFSRPLLVGAIFWILAIVSCNRAMAQDIWTWKLDTVETYYFTDDFGNKHLYDPSNSVMVPVVGPLTIADPPSNQELFRYPAEVVEVIDGDTFWAVVKIPSLPGINNYKDFEKHRIKIRLWKCNTPETNTRSRRFRGWTQEEKSEEKRKGESAKQWAIKNFDGIGVTLVYKDKYRNNRWVAETVCKDGETMKSKLRKAGHLDGKYEN